MKNSGQFHLLHYKDQTQILKQNKTVNCVNLGHVGYGDVPGLSAHTDGKVGFKCRFVKTREGGSSMCRLKLSGRQHPKERKIILLSFYVFKATSRVQPSNNSPKVKTHAPVLWLSYLTSPLFAVYLPL